LTLKKLITVSIYNFEFRKQQLWLKFRVLRGVPPSSCTAAELKGRKSYLHLKNSKRFQTKRNLTL